MENKQNGKGLVLFLVITVITLLVACGALLYLFLNEKKSDIVESSTTTSTVKLESNLNDNYNISVKQDKYEEKIGDIVLYDEYKDVVTLTNESNSEIAKAITKDINAKADEIWKEIIKSGPKFQVMPTENELSYIKGFGVDLKVRVDYMNKSIMQFNIQYDGSFGGSTWVDTYSYTYSLKTGKLLTINDITNDSNKFAEVVKNAGVKYFKENLKDQITVPEWEDLIEDILLNNWEFTKDGMSFRSPKYSLTQGAAGVIFVDISYNELNGLLIEDYQVK